MKVKKVALVTPFDYRKKVWWVEVFVKLFKDILEKNWIKIDIYDESYFKSYRNSFTLMYRLWRIKKLNFYDLIFCNWWSWFSLLRRKNTVNLYHWNQAWFFIKNKKTFFKTIGFLIWYFYELFSWIWRIKVAVSKQVKKDLEKYYNFSWITVIQNAVNTDLFKPISNKTKLREIYNVSQKSKVLFFAGRYVYMKWNDVLFLLMGGCLKKKIFSFL